MDYRTWNTMESGTLVKTFQGGLYEVVKPKGYTRGRPHAYEAINLLETAKWGKPVAATLYRYNVEDYTKTNANDPSVKAMVILFGR